MHRESRGHVVGRFPQDPRDVAFLERHGIPLAIHHASGHAFIPDLKRLVEALAPHRVVPIHTFAGERFGEFFHRVECHADGEWWEV